MIKSVKTVAQFKITEWVQENVVTDSVKISYTSDNSATIIDTTG